MKIPYRINQIRTVQFVIFPEKYDNKNDITVHTNVSFAVKNDLSDVRCIMEVSYAQADELLLKAQVLRQRESMKSRKTKRYLLNTLDILRPS